MVKIIALLAAFASPSAAQDSTPPGYKAYKLQHASAPEFGAQLRKMLAATPGKPDVLVDRQQQRVLVQGSEEAQRIAAQLVKALDRPAKDSDGEGPREPAAARRPARVDGGRYRLANISWRELEDELRRTWGDKLLITASRSGELATVQLPGAADATAVMQIDRVRGEISLAGPAGVIEPWEKIVRALDVAHGKKDIRTQIMPIRRADPAQIVQAVTLMRDAMRGGSGDSAASLRLKGTTGKSKRGAELVSMIFQPPPRPAGDEDPEEEMPAPEPPPAAEGGLLGPVQIEYIEALEMLVIRGNKRDVEKVLKIIEDIERESEKSKPEIEVYHLRHVGSQAISELVQTIYTGVLSSRQGQVSITPLIKPNAVLLIGRKESINAVVDLIERLDRPDKPQSLFQVFRLKYMNSVEAQTALQTLFTATGTGLSARVTVVPEPRSNSLIVQGAPRDLAEVKKLIEQIDVGTSSKTMEFRVFKLKNALATELAPVLQNALIGRRTNAQGGQGGQAIDPGTLNVQGATQGGANQQSLGGTLQFIDRENGQLLKGTILTDVIVTADNRNNSLIVRAPPESMELIAAIIDQLDHLPVAEANIKVFSIFNGDATNLATMLQQLFGVAGQGGQGGPGGGGGGAQAFLQSPTGSGESLLVQLRFAVDTRTNSIIASGTGGDLDVVEAVIVRLDQAGIQGRTTTVYRLNNAPAVDVANSINQMITSRRQIYNIAQNVTSVVERVDREVVVVPEIVTNSLIVSATPKYFDEVKRVVEQLDARPPMVLIQVVIAEVTLQDQKELGLELGLQDSLLFTRGIINQGNPIGFLFNTPALGNGTDANSLGTRNNVAGQGLTNFGVGRTNAILGYSGLTLSASSETVSALFRALHDQQRLQVLSRPQVMTLNNQPAFVQVGQRVPRITNSTLGVTGTSNATELINVGILLGVTPRTSPDGLVVMEINAEKSAVGAEADGIPISINTNGDVIRSPKINISTAQTTVSAKSGQTVIFAGLITKEKTNVTRRAPYLSDVPILGNLFRFDSQFEKRTELVIIMTPYVLRNEEDADWVKRMEADRMSWCLADVIEIHQEGKGLSGNRGPWGSESMPFIYPDQDPTGLETVPTPPPVPGGTPSPQAGPQNGTDASAPVPRIRPELAPPDRSSLRTPRNSNLPPSQQMARKEAASGSKLAASRPPKSGPEPASRQALPEIPLANTTTKVWNGPAPKMPGQLDFRPVPSLPQGVAPASFDDSAAESRQLAPANQEQPLRFPEVK